MKLFFISIMMTGLLVSCYTARPVNTSGNTEEATGWMQVDTPITESLFNDKMSSISEENIQKILDGAYRLPDKIRIAIFKMENSTTRRNYWYYQRDESFLKAEQASSDLLLTKLRAVPNVTSVVELPNLLISSSPNFTTLREAAVRMQADIVIVYSVYSDIYSKYKVFSKPELKAFATVQTLLLDVRNGLIPFSQTITKDAQTVQKKEDFNISEAEKRIQQEATQMSLNEIIERLTQFLSQKK